MKKLSFIFALSALLFVKGNAQDRIMLIADPHVLPQTIITADPNFSTKNENEIKMFRLSESIWHALMDTALAYRPSLVLLPGDLSRNGEPAALDTVAAGLAADAPQKCIDFIASSKAQPMVTLKSTVISEPEASDHRPLVVRLAY